MTSLYAKYIKEREGKDIVEDENGFATYILLPNCLYVVDVFVVKEKRQEGLAKCYFYRLEDLAKEKKLEYIMTSLDNSDENHKIKLEALYRDGYNICYLSEENEGFFYLKKRIKNGK